MIINTQTLIQAVADSERAGVERARRHPDPEVADYEIESCADVVHRRIEMVRLVEALAEQYGGEVHA